MSKHFFLDGYGVNSQELSSSINMNNLLEVVNSKYFHGKGKKIIIPYFNGKIKKDGGVSGIILGNNMHFTCHTFSYKETFFVDYFGNSHDFDNVKNDVLRIYKTDDFDLCTKKTDGNFGKHLIYSNVSVLSFDEAKALISMLLTNIGMTSINDVIINYADSEHFDLLQPIAESHISVHRNGSLMVIDVFSCKWFNEEKVSNLLNSSNYEKICRGVKYR